ncbi:hypothetical protein GCM10022291_12410 [Postechiella marina]|uniref:Polysaccharide chain length determinant N-terminal domain-containing protein n=1 Tax=Postechiella marina TaxID=943941 RepID=A0ABP8C692_9FLAO
MSKELPQSKQSEEVDLGQLFKLIGNAFDRLFKFIGSIFKSIFSVIIYALKVVINNYKLIIITMVLAGIIGYGLEKVRKPVYTSNMLVKPYFDSKYQLVTNIRYYNALIADKDYKQLENLFKINEADAASLLEFEISPGPETENDRILQYDRFIKAVDSARAQTISYRDFLENRSVYSGSIFEISVQSLKKDIFRSLEEGLNSTFTNTYSVKKMQKRDSLISLDKARIKQSLKQVDSLKRVYIAIMKSESETNNSPVTLKEGGAMVQERVKTKEFELLAKELDLRNELNRLESQQVEEDVYFDTISSFQDVGSAYSSLFNKYSLIFPIISFLLLMLGYLAFRVIVFVKKYE